MDDFAMTSLFDDMVEAGAREVDAIRFPHCVGQRPAPASYRYARASLLAALKLLMEKVQNDSGCDIVCIGARVESRQPFTNAYWSNDDVAQILMAQIDALIQQGKNP